MDVMPKLPDYPRKYSRWIHVKSGHTYMVMGLAWEEKSLLPVVIYQRYELGPNHQGPGFMDNSVWTRPLTEFLDGRFLARD